jgi:hypothetical protein
LFGWLVVRLLFRLCGSFYAVYSAILGWHLFSYFGLASIHSQAMIDNLHNLAHEKMKLENLSQKDRTRIREAKRQLSIDMDETTLKLKLQVRAVGVIIISIIITIIIILSLLLLLLLLFSLVRLIDFHIVPFVRVSSHFFACSNCLVVSVYSIFILFLLLFSCLGDANLHAEKPSSLELGSHSGMKLLGGEYDLLLLLFFFSLCLLWSETVFSLSFFLPFIF